MPSFRVITIGNIATGKTSLLNALMGEVLLPHFNCPVNIRFGKSPNATIYSEKPAHFQFNVCVEDLRKFIDNKDINRVTIEFPIKFRDFDFVDIPGLSWENRFKDIIMNYLPTANVILYCMDVTRALTVSEMTEIELLRKLGYDSMIFVLTHFDNLEYEDMINDMINHADKARQYYTNRLSNYTNLGPEGVFFTGSKQSLMGKNKNEASMVCSSHLLELEIKLKGLYAKWQSLH